MQELGKEYVELDGPLGPCPTAAELKRHKPSRGREYPIYLAFPKQGVSLTVEEGDRVRAIVYLERCP